ncbi:MAG: NAD(P)/FAD-dependent oxidoreductase [Thermoanaerobaculia bacterium]
MSSHHGSTEEFDVIVVGARVAGAATAMLLARQGLAVLAVDRGQYGSDTLSTHALMRAGVLQLHRWGLLDAVREAGTPRVQRTLFHYPDETITINIKPADGIDGLYAPKRTVIDRILADAAREAGAEVRFGVGVDDLLRDDSGRVLGVVGHDKDRNQFEARAAITIGADGVKSKVAQLVEAEVIRPARGAGSVVYGYFEGVEADAFEWAYSPDATTGFIPTNDGQVVVFVCTRPERFRAEVQSDLTAGFHMLLEESAPEIARRVAGGRLVGRLRGFTDVEGYMRRSWGSGWALVGDAGYFKDPITAHGISDALRDAELLARAVVQAHQRPENEAAALAQYESVRDEVSHDLFEATEIIASFGWTMPEVKQHLINLSKAMGPEVELLLGLDQSSTQT